MSDRFDRGHGPFVPPKPQAEVDDELRFHLERRIQDNINRGMTPEAARQAQIAAGAPEYLADALGELFAERRNGGEAKVYPTFQELTGRKPVSFESASRRWSVSSVTRFFE